MTVSKRFLARLKWGAAWTRMMCRVTSLHFLTSSLFLSEKEVGKKKGGWGQYKKAEAQAGQESSDDEDSNQAGE